MTPLALVLATLAALCAAGPQEPVPAETPAPVETPDVQEPPAPDDDPAPPPETPRETPADTPGPEAERPPREGDPAAEETGDAAEPAPVLGTRSRFDFLRGASHEAVLGELGRLARLEPERLAITPYGTSRDGRELLVATLGERGDSAPDERPALFLVADLDTPGTDGPAPPTAGLFVVTEMIARAKGEERVRNLLRRAAVHVVLLPDPDALAGTSRALADARPASAPLEEPGDPDGAPESSGDGGRRREARVERFPRADLNRNFPEGWSPFAANGAQRDPGPYPLCEPETLALARYLLERPSVRGTVLWTRRPGGVGGCAANGYRAGALQQLGLGQAEADGVCARSGLIDEPGSLARFCRAALEGPVLFAPAWEGPELDTVIGPAPAGFVRLVDLVVAMLEELPRIELGEPAVERLRADLWQVDLPVRRGGALANAQPATHAPEPIPGLALAAAGAEVQVVALRAGDGEAFQPLAAAGAEVALGALPAEGTLVVRLVVAAEDEASSLELTLDAPSTGPAQLRVALE